MLKSPFHRAFFALVICLLLLRVGTNYYRKHLSAALMDAIVQDNTSAVAELLKRGADPDLPAPDGTTALVLATRRGAANTVKLLLEKGVQPEEQALIWAAFLGRTAILQMLLDHGARAEPASGQSPLFFATTAGHPEAAKLLLSHGADPNEKDRNGWEGRGFTVLMAAAAGGRVQVIRTLLDAGANVNAGTQCDAETDCIAGYTPLLYAAESGHLEAVQALLAHKAQVNAIAANGDTALKLAIKFKYPRIAAQLKKAGAKE